MVYHTHTRTHTHTHTQIWQPDDLMHVSHLRLALNKKPRVLLVLKQGLEVHVRPRVPSLVPGAIVLGGQLVVVEDGGYGGKVKGGVAL